MFENSGEKIMKLAKILFVVSIIATIILAIAYGWTNEYSRYSGFYKEFQPIPFFSILIGGFVASYVESLLVYAFGELVANSASISAKLKKLDEKSSADYTNYNSSQSTQSPSISSSTSTNRTSAQPQGTKRLIKCPSCGEENPKDKFFCVHCGAKL